jgi:hypothetical protein
MIFFRNFLLTLICFLLFLGIAGSASAQVVINEYYTPTTSDWVELFSPTDADISGFVIRDATSTNKKVIADGVVLGPSTNTLCYVDFNRWLDNSGDIVKLEKPGGILIDSHTYSSNPGEGFSWCRIPDGGDWNTCNPPTKATVECNGLAVQATQTATSSPTQTDSKSTVEIKQAKDEEGNPLNQVKIYVDDVYVKHYTPETLQFCETCKCETANCNFGNHNFKFERNGYETHTKSLNIESGKTYTIEPILKKSATVSQNTSISPTITHQNTITPAISPTSAGQVLSAEGNLNFENPYEKRQETAQDVVTQNINESLGRSGDTLIKSDKKLNLPVEAIILITSGLSVMGISLYPYFKRYKLNKSEKFDELQKQEEA